MPQPRDPLFFIPFDQRIDPAAVLEDHPGQRRRPAPSALVLVSEAEIQTSREWNKLSCSKDAAEGRWLAFRPASRCPPTPTSRSTIGPGTPSAEGPLITKEAQTYSFRTYAPAAHRGSRLFLGR